MTNTSNTNVVAPIPDPMIRGWKGITREVPKSRTQLWRDVRNGLFPPPSEIGANSIAWDREVIRNWKATRPHRQYGLAVQTDRPPGTPTNTAAPSPIEPPVRRSRGRPRKVVAPVETPPADAIGNPLND